MAGFIPLSLKIPNQDTLLPVIKRKIIPDSIVYTDCYKSYDVLDVREFTHHRINHSQLFTDCQNHINGIENFWNQAKWVLRKYKCEFRFNFGTPKEQLKILRI